jgi:hypothetical protein
LGGSGRTVVGQLTSNPGEDTAEWIPLIQSAALVPRREEPEALKIPQQSSFGDQQAFQTAIRQFSEKRQSWLQSAEGVAWQLNQVEYALRIKEEGSFRVDSVPPGEYILRVLVGSSAGPGPQNSITRQITIPDQDPDEPVDLGRVKVSQ